MPRPVSHAGGPTVSLGLRPVDRLPEPPPPTPAETPQQAAAPARETERPRFDLGFDPDAKASLPFDIPGQSEAEAGQAAGAAAPSATFPAPSFPAPLMPAPSLPGLPFPGVPPQRLSRAGHACPGLSPGSGEQDFLPSPRRRPNRRRRRRTPPKILHIRCPSGHLVKAKSDLLGKNGRCPACKKTFELRYEDSVEFQRRKEKILHREEIKAGRAWVAWALLAAFLLFVGLVA